MYQSQEHSNEELQTFIEAPGRHIVFLSVDWCGDCRVIKPFVQSIREEVEKTADWMDADRDKNLEWASQYGLKGIPAFILFQDGKKINQIGHGERITPKQITEWYENTLK